MTDIVLNGLPAAAQYKAALIAGNGVHAQQALRDLLEEAARIAVDDARAAHEAFLTAYGRMTAILALGTRETIAMQRLAAESGGIACAGALLCNLDELPYFEKRATMPPWPSGSPFFEAYPSQSVGALPVSPVLEAARRAIEDSIDAQLDEIIRSTGEA